MRKVRKLLAAVAAAMLLALLAVPAAAEEVWDGATIGSVEDLQAFAAAVNAGDTFSGKTVTLTADIDLAGVEWTPIGYMGATFRGTFEGGGRTISNLYVNKGLENTAANNGVGLFGRTDSPAVIRNLTIENADVSGSLYAGAVVGLGYTGTGIENVTVKGNITIDAWWYAGVIGGNGYMSLIDNCHVIGNEGSYIRGNDGSYIGGIWGFRGEGGAKITNCSVKNLSISGVDRVGGISGMAHYGNEISGCTVENAVIQASDGSASTVGLIAGACQGEEGSPSVFSGNAVADTTAFAGEIPVAELYGTNISGTAAVTNYTAQVGTAGYASFREALAAAEDGDTVLLLCDVVTGTNGASDGAGAFNVESSITIDGNGYTITAGAAYSSPRVHILNIADGAAVTVQDLTIDAAGKANYGMNVYGASAELKRVSVINGKCYGLGLNGANVTADGLTTSGSAYAGMNVDSKNGLDSVLTVNTAVLNEECGIYLENSNGDADVTAYIQDGTYNTVAVSENADGAKTLLSITGGSFTADVSGYCAEGYGVMVGDTYVVHQHDQKDVIPGLAETCTVSGLTDGAKCSKCGTVVKEQAAIPASHKLTVVKANAATCTEAGNIAYESCSVCGENFDAEGKPLTNVAVNALGHKYSEYVSDGNASCTADGTKTAECDNGCGKTDTVSDKDSKLGHKLTKVAAKAPTAETEGNIEHYVCSVCGKLYTDETMAKEITQAETVISKLTSNGNPATGDAVLMQGIAAVLLSGAGVAALAPKKREET